MAVNDEERQAAVAAEVEYAARTLAHSTRAVPVPSDSYALLGEVSAAVESIEQVCRQLAAWHDGTHDGVEYDGEDERGDGSSTAIAAHELRAAVSALDMAGSAIRAAHSVNGMVRWR